MNTLFITCIMFTLRAHGRTILALHGCNSFNKTETNTWCYKPGRQSDKKDSTNMTKFTTDKRHQSQCSFKVNTGRYSDRPDHISKSKLKQASWYLSFSIIGQQLHVSICQYQLKYTQAAFLLYRRTCSTKYVYTQLDTLGHVRHLPAAVSASSLQYNWPLLSHCYCVVHHHPKHEIVSNTSCFTHC